MELSTRSAEAAEAELTRFIEHRDDKRRQMEGERREQEMWMESAARYNERERRQIRAEWYGWHCCDQAERHRRTLERLIAHHEGESQKLMEDDEAKGA